MPRPISKDPTAVRRPLRNEFGAASRRSLALGPGSHSAFAACARESGGESCAQTLNRAFPEACNAAKRSGRLSGTQRKTREAQLTLPFAEVSDRLRVVSQAGGSVRT